MTDIRKINKELMSDILDVFPFYGKRIPKTMKCVEVEASDAGIDWYEGHGDISEIPWSFAKFKGKFISIAFEYDPEYNSIMPCEFKILGTPTPYYRGDFEFFTDEVKFISDILNSR